MTGIDTQGAEAIDAALRRITCWWHTRKARKAETAHPGQYQWISDAIRGRRNGDHEHDC